MCRMFGMVADSPTACRDLLHEAPRSLCALSRQHPDGWGVAVHDGDWHIERSVETAHACGRFAQVTASARLVIAHVRQKTVGPRALANTHPFRRGRFVFAHNGTVDTSGLRIAPEHLAAIEGDTDSERLFAFVLTEIDAAGDVARGVAAAVRALHALPSPGSANFLLSCGTRLYAHRLGRSMVRLDRPGVTLIASEPLTDEPWVELPERSLIELEPTRATGSPSRARASASAACRYSPDHLP